MLNPVSTVNINSENQYEYPSISKMPKDEIVSFKKVVNWVQRRTLFCDEETSWDGRMDSRGSLCYFGGSSYDGFFPGGKGKNVLKDIMRTLKSNDIYMDVGAGDGHAIHQYREVFPQGAEVIGIASTQPHDIERVINEEKRDGKFSFYLADFNEFPTESLAGRVSVITDIKGAFRYGLNPTCTIKKMGALLKEGGVAIIEFGRGLGIDPPSLIEDKYNVLDSRHKDWFGSKMLLHLWFHTIKGFDVIQKNMDLEFSRQIHAKVIEKPEAYERDNFGLDLMIIRRNSDPIEVEELIPNPKFIKDWSEIEDSERDYDDCCPKYTWKTSEASEALLAKITWLNQ